MTKKNNFFIIAVIFLMLFAIEFNQNCSLCMYCPINKTDDCCSSSNSADWPPELFDKFCNHSEDLGCSCFECIKTSFKQKDVYGVSYLNELNGPIVLSLHHSVKTVFLPVTKESFSKTKLPYSTAPLYILNHVLTI